MYTKVWTTEWYDNKITNLIRLKALGHTQDVFLSLQLLISRTVR